MKKSFSARNALLVGGCLMALSGLSLADSDWLKGTVDEKLAKLADIQPGLGTVMMEYSARFTNAYYAAHGGNWGLADYMIKEMPEIQEVGENTRPKRAEALKEFESKHLSELQKAVSAQDIKAFDTAFQDATKACNECHHKAHFNFINYQLPASAPTPLKLTK
ncbi:MAG TPA: hypothetical protein VF801_12930 [Rhodocyclaceae bacterium]